MGKRENMSRFEVYTEYSFSVGVKEKVRTSDRGGDHMWLTRINEKMERINEKVEEDAKLIKMERKRERQEKKIVIAH